MSDRTKAKRWCFTINNPFNVDPIIASPGAEDDPDEPVVIDLRYPFWYHHAMLAVFKVEYMVAQIEKGENGTPHWQGFIIFKDQKRLQWLKDHLDKRAHWEVARGTNQQASEYCKKDETYDPSVIPADMKIRGRFEWGSMPERNVPKKDERLKLAADELDTIKDGYKRPAEIDSLTLMQCGFIPAYKELTADILGPYRPKLQIITMIGPPGTGKSYAIQQYFPNHGRCICGNNGVWFQNPTAPVMVFEEFCGQIQLQRMLQYLDPYPLALEVKGGMRPAMYETVIITSNTRPDGWYTGDQAGQPGKRTDALLALWDRLGFESGAYVPVRTCGHYWEVTPGWSIEEARDFFTLKVTRFLDIAEIIDDEDGQGHPGAAAAADSQEEHRSIYHH
ncbi:replication associated protein [Bovine faeces associated circular DNA virus 1]|uniref:Replication associated protein n=1 Tax=Bovine faeces associated circular DNA virus 1 TaxID=1843764 RepID=A0A160HWI2_9VIRU|nr:replication associated protein [Bovine faeces associated circular DNA virus 1]ANC51547.1 replication associated protein [Bovine faeces associated circular DNA virus 1]